MSNPATRRAIFFAAILMLGGLTVLSPPAAADSWVKVDLGKPYNAANSILYGVSVGDGDRDNLTEVYYTCANNGHVYEFTFADGNWSFYDMGALNNSAYADAVLVGDGDDDGNTEVYATGMAYINGEYQGHVYQFVKTGNSWVLTDLGTAGEWGVDIVMGDGNRDSRTELYVADSLAGHIYQFAKSNGWNTQDVGSAPPYYWGSYWYMPYMAGVAVGDGDNDGAVEVYGAASEDHIYRFNWSDSKWNRTDMGAGEVLDPALGMRAIALGDGDNDGKNEVYGASFWNGTVWQYKWNGTSKAWGITRPYLLGASVEIKDICIGDGNSDGRNELYLATSDRQLRQLAYNNTTGEWDATTLGSGNSVSYAIDIGSATGDLRQKEIYAACGDGHAYQYYIDTIPPANPIVWSDTHPNPGTWYNKNVVHVLWKDLGFDISGIDGYSIAWDNSPNTVPDDVRDLQETVHDATSPALPDGGNHYFHIRARDNSLNWNASATHFGPICIDTTPPWSVGITINGGDQYTNRSLATLSIVSSEPAPGSGVGWMSFSNDGKSWSEWENFCSTRAAWDLTESRFGGSDSDGLKTVTARVKDLAGNEIPAENRSGDSIFLDRVAPVELSLTINGNAVYASSENVTLNLSARDPDPASGLWQMGFSNDGVIWSEWTDWNQTTGWSLTAGAGGTDNDGNRTVYMRVKDRAGNIGGPVSATMFLDRKSPENLSVRINNGDAFTNISTVSLAIAANDPIPGSQLDEMALANDAGSPGTWEAFATSRSGWSLIFGGGGTDADGDKQVSLRVRDRAGNSAGPVMDTIFLDRIVPGQLAIIINDGAAYTTSLVVNLTLRAADPDPASGVDIMQFSNDGTMWTGWEPFSIQKSYTLPALDGTKAVFFRVKDRAGNLAGSVNDTIILDTAPPVISNVRVVGITDKSAVITWSTNEEADSGIDYGVTVAYAASRLDPTYVTSHSIALNGLTPTTTYHFRVYSRDRAGNAPSYSIDYVFITTATPDIAPPMISNVQVSGITDRLAVVSWNTNEAADSLVEYGSGTSYGLTAKQSSFVLKHSLAITGLSPSTRYHFRVSSTDPSGNGPSLSGDYTFMTLGAPDTLPPVISNVRVGGITDRLAVITWETDEPADGAVEFGLNASYGMFASHSSLLALHEITIIGLQPSTVYHFRIRCTDASGNGPALSKDFNFTTLTSPDSWPPAILNIAVVDITETTATIIWETDELADGTVEYGLTAAYGLTVADADYALRHGLLLQGLSGGKTYHFRVRSTDPSGNAATSVDMTFRTGEHSAGPDTAPPLITGLEVKGISDTRAVVIWFTDEAADGEVEYGVTVAYGLRSSDPTYVLIHSIVLEGLSPSTGYHLRVRSTDIFGNGPSLSPDITFSTSANPDRVPPLILGVNYTDLTNDSVVITWTTDEPASSIVEYGSDVSYGKNLASQTYLLSHSVRLTGLTPGTTYHFRVRSVDPSANPSNPSAGMTFTTLKVSTPPGPGPKPAPAVGGFPWPWLAVLILIGVVAGAAYYKLRRRPMQHECTTKTPAPTKEELPPQPVWETEGTGSLEPVQPAEVADPGEEEVETLAMEETTPTPTPPARTIRCTNCGSPVPVPSGGYPVRLTCPGCGRSGMYKGPRTK